jgi:hypothetical protein
MERDRAPRPGDRVEYVGPDERYQGERGTVEKVTYRGVYWHRDNPGNERVCLTPPTSLFVVEERGPLTK